MMVTSTTTKKHSKDGFKQENVRITIEQVKPGFHIIIRSHKRDADSL